MERKMISIERLVKVLTPKEMKNVTGGSGGGEGNCWKAWCITATGGEATTVRPQSECTCESLWDECESFGWTPIGCCGAYC